MKLRAPDAECARAVVRHDPGRVAVEPADDKWVVTGVNTPSEYEALIK